MKDILLKLSNGVKTFNCRWHDKENECEILIIDMQKCMAFVRFKTPVKKIVRREVDTKFLFGGMGDDISMEDVEIESFEEWISLPNF